MMSAEQQGGEELLDAIVHLFLTKRTPGKAEPHPEKIDKFILHTLNQSVSKLVGSKFIEVDGVRKMLSWWECHQPYPSSEASPILENNFPMKFVHAVSSLNAYNILPIYIRKQNCTLLIDREDDGTLHVETFRASLPSKLVMSSVGSLSMNYPERSEIIQDNDLLLSHSFAKCLHELSVQQLNISVPHFQLRQPDRPSVPNLRDVPEPTLINDWIVALLSPSLASEGDDEGSRKRKRYRICKKIRDQVTFPAGAGTRGLLPFRRSGMWMSIKVVIQLQLLNIFRGDMVTAMTVFKLLLLQYLTDICQVFYETKKSEIDPDLAAQMQAKIGRRLYKLSKCFPETPDGKNEANTSPMQAKLPLLKTEVFNNVHRVVNTFHHFMNKCQRAMIKSYNSQLHPKRLWTDNLSDRDHSIPFLSSLWKELQTNRPCSETSSSAIIPNLLNIHRYITLDAILAYPGHSTSDTPLQQRIWLHDTETIMKTGLKLNHDTGQIRALVLKYTNTALGYYPNCKDPIGVSQMVLAVLKAVQILDRIATSAHPFLLDYESGINVSSFDCLLLPHKDDLSLLEETLDYFRNRNLGAKIPEGIIGEDTIREISFSSRFASQDPGMTKVRNEILEKTELNVTRKLSEIEEGRKNIMACKSKIIKLKKELEMGGITFQIFLDQTKLLDGNINSLRVKFNLFEHPLPNEKYFQDTVIFEALVPEEIYSLRDCLAILKLYLLDECPVLVEQNKPVLEWLKYENMTKYLSETPRVRPNPVITLGSQRLSFLQNLRMEDTNPDLLYCSNEMFIHGNGLGVGYSYSFAHPPLRNLTAACTFQINDTEKYEAYLPLQQYLESHQHSQNEVIADQQACNENLPFHEFLTFGSIRAGHRIQLRNLYRAIVSKQLSFEEEPVLALTLQTIWQIGPRENTSGKRGAHIDFEHQGFSSVTLETLDSFIKENETNYRHSLKMMTAVLITVRILDINDGMSSQCHKLLRRCRTIMSKWVCNIEDTITSETNPVHVRELKKILMLVSISCSLSYNLSASIKWDQFMNEEDDIVGWFHNCIRLNNSSTQLSRFMSTLLHFAKTTALRLQLEKYVTDSAILSESVHKFAAERSGRQVDFQQSISFDISPESSNGVISLYSIRPHTSSGWIAGNDTVTSVTFDCIQGKFLLNGFSEENLSVDISGSKRFKRFFGEQHELRVQRESASISRTVNKFRGRHYEFRIIPFLYASYPKMESNSKDCTITEICDDGTRATMIESGLFEQILPPYFTMANKFTYWLNSIGNVVNLRNAHVQETDLNHSEYQLVRKDNTDAWQLTDTRHNRQILSFHSSGFQQVTEVLKQIELSQFINVFVDCKKNAVIAHLPRYNLQFVLNGGRLECVQHPGFYVEGKKRPTTLVGLEQCLYLKSNDKGFLIIPHGVISLVTNTTKILRNTGVCRIGLDQLGQPPYFKYDADHVLSRLVAAKSKCAWLYLAALHAVTSLSLPDRFTGVTGTEMAVRILQSGYVWSCVPYDEDCLRILDFIRGLAPTGYYHRQQKITPTNASHEEEGGSMELKEWPCCGFPTLSAYDGFGIIADKLIQDSVRLRALHHAPNRGLQKNKQAKSNELTSNKLRLRNYFRHLGSYNHAAQVQPHFFHPDVQERLKKSKQRAIRNSRLDDLNITGVCQLAEHRLSPSMTLPPGIRAKSFKKNNLVQFLSHNYELPLGDPLVSVKDMFSMGLKTSWFSLYKLATKGTECEEDVHNLTLILSAMAYKNEDIIQLLNLQYISGFASTSDFPTAPQMFPQEFTCSNELIIYHSVSDLEAAVQNLIGDHVRQLPGECMGQGEIQIKAGDAAQALREKYFPCAIIPMTESEKVENLLLDHFPTTSKQSHTSTKKLLSDVNALLQTYWNGKLVEFTNVVQSKLDTIYDPVQHVNDPGEQSGDDGISYMVNVTGVNWSVGILPESLLQTPALNKELWEDAETVFRSGVGANVSNLEQLERQQTLIRENLLNMITATAVGRTLSLTRHSPRLDPITLLEYLIPRQGRNEHDIERNIIHVYSGSLAVFWTHVKRLNRCKHYRSTGQHAELEGEKDNKGHENWSPRDYPAWLLLELELDIMIRPIQVDVAKQMMEMPAERNGVMQLNMGEGKTSVIVPMLCSILGCSEKICRVTVLGSMFNMNQRNISFAIGGLLNRRSYSFPCKRDMPIDKATVDNIQETYMECLRLTGVVITQPDYRLSFRLLAYDSILKKKVSLGLKLLSTENWLRKHARDILDESDELLNVKYQLVYTVGEQIPLDGGEMRWTTCQRLLQIVQKMGPAFLGSNAPGVMELNLDNHRQHPHRFSPLRLLDSKIFPNFVSTVADHFLQGINITQAEKTRMKNFLTQENIRKKDLEEALNSVADMPELVNQILLVSGYLRRGVLTFGLSKRWRVDYGVDPKNPLRQMAVPFRAKDVPAEKAEFGHPDLAILLTHLSYYYSGLSDKQLEDTFRLLKSSQGSEARFASWIKPFPNDQVPANLRNLSGLDLRNTHQRSSLFKLLREHKQVIDFWLSNKIFSREARQFPSKLVLTSWDLCYERSIHPVTGFSGTNDSSILLPLSISQQDLAILGNTNAQVETDLLQHENKGHRKFTTEASCRDILTTLKEDNLTVLIDAGALMLDCDNEQVAKLWLEIDNMIEAVLYFNGNELTVKSRGDQGTSKHSELPFEHSSYQWGLAKCAIFLDDQHTRGTDLNLPNGTRACVTVGGRMKRDKLIQACMRMRKLGQGHSVTFYLSQEAYDCMRKDGGNEEEIEIKTDNVLKWVTNNTQKFNEDGLLHWAIAGKNYAQRLAAEDSFYYPDTFKEFNPDGYSSEKKRLAAKGKVLGAQCADVEITTLVDMYGQHCRVDLLVRIIHTWFEAAMGNLKHHNHKCNIPNGILENCKTIRSKVIQRCQAHVPTQTHLSGLNMEEEQERELSPEKETEHEEERVIERRRGAKPAASSLHQNIIRVVIKGRAIRFKGKVREGIMRLPDIFKDTTFWKKVQPKGWGNAVFATRDFVDVIINDKYVNTDQFIRPVEWVVSVRGGQGSGHLLVLSPYEVNELMPWFKTKNVACTLHMFTPRRSENQDFLLNESRLSLPSGGPFRPIPERCRCIAALLLASGNLYFGSVVEKKAFARFLSLAPHPWSQEENEMFEKQLITRTGFMLPSEGSRPRGFHSDPRELVRMLLRCAHPHLSEAAHVVQLLDQMRLDIGPMGMESEMEVDSDICVVMATNE